MRGSRIGMILLGVFTVCVYIFKFLPVLVVVALAFNPPEFGSFPMTGVTLRWFREVLADDDIVAAIENSVILGIIAASISTVIGTAASYALVRFKFRGQNFVQMALSLPILVPHLILGVGLLLAFRMFGLGRSFPMMVIGHVALTLPFVVLTVQHRFRAIPAHLEEAARTLGASRWHMFREVTFPLALPAVIVGLVFAFMSSFDEVTATIFWRPANFETVPLYVFAELQNSVSQGLNALAALLILFSIAVPMLTLLLVHVFTSRGRQPSSTGLTT